MSTNNRRHQVFIDQMILHNDAIKAYKAAYPNCKKDTTARVNSYKLLQITTIAAQIATGLEENRRVVHEARRKQLEKEAQENVISEAEVDAVLSKIITGEMEQEKKAVVYNRDKGKFETVTYFEKPDATQRINAADKYYKRKGSYAPSKTEDVTKPQVIVPGE